MPEEPLQDPAFMQTDVPQPAEHSTVLCPHCNYDLFGTIVARKSLCPECGIAFSIVIAGHQPSPAKWVPLFATFAIATGTGLTFTLYVSFSQKASLLEPEVLICLGFALLAFMLSVITYDARNRVSHQPRAIRWLATAFAWALILLFWAWLSPHSKLD